MICRCSVRQYRFNQGYIPKPSILKYKQNLSLLSHRYTQMQMEY